MTQKTQENRKANTFEQLVAEGRAMSSKQFAIADLNEHKDRLKHLRKYCDGIPNDYARLCIEGAEKMIALAMKEVES
jgi:hypothetical protein